MNRVYLERRMPPNLKLNIMFVAAVFLIGLYVGFTKTGFSLKDGLWEGLLLTVAILLPPLYLQIRMARGNLISYDDEAVYYRPDGTNWKLQYKPEKVMTYDDIDVVCGDPGKIINFGIMPFEFVRLYRKNWDGEELFMISPFYLFHDEMKELIWFIYNKRPDAFAQDVIDYLNSDQRL